MLVINRRYYVASNAARKGDRYDAYGKPKMWLVRDWATDGLIKGGFTSRQEAADFAVDLLTGLKQQVQALRKLGKYDIVQTHDDGDLTVRVGDKLYVVTTEGQVFLEQAVPATPPVHAAVVPVRGERDADNSRKLDWMADSPEYLAQTIDSSGWRDKLDQEFQAAIARARGA